MRFFAARYFVSALLLLLAGCGGGGSAPSATTPSGPYINFVVSAVPTGVGGSLQYNAYGYVNETSMTSLPITNATVTINGVSLTYDAVAKWYWSFGLPATLPDANGKLNLTVIARGVTYAATQDAPDTLPVLTVPNPIVAANASTASWTQNVSTHGFIPSYYYFMAYTGTPGAALTYQSITTSTSANMPVNTFSAGTTYYFAVNSEYPAQPIANTAPYSGFYVLAQSTSSTRIAQ